jgi:exodeoxyribonuclease-5
LQADFEKYLGKTPSAGQAMFFQKFEKFLKDDNTFSAFVLRGYAGTGKTTTVKAIVAYLKANKFKSVLLAPTGRAAKVLSNYSGENASTIHKKIYRRKSSVDILASFTLNENKHKDTIFIVDESSMISGTMNDSTGVYFSKGSLLDDLVEYVYSNTNNCRLLLVGDTAQLPPVGSDFSPALNKEMLHAQYGLRIYEHELTEVLRQEKASGILENATDLRELIDKNIIAWPQLKAKGYKDFYSITGEQLSDGINYAYDEYGIDETLIVCRSNKNANQYNQQIRSRILFREEEISAGDYLMVVKNNYYWLPAEEQGFIANGEIVRVVKVGREEELHGFRFADMTVQLVDLPNEPKLSVKVLIDTIYADAPSLKSEDQKKLFDSVSADYADILNKKERYEKIKADPYYNALQVKFAYAVTCHKAQGGQWKVVFVDQGYLVDDMLNLDLLRWLYTAITRASFQVFLVNFHPKFFK